MNTILALVWLHFVFDFVFQTNDMAMNKSKSNKWLLAHIAVYTSPFIFFGIKFALVNGVAHFLTDWITSRINSHLWKQGSDPSRDVDSRKSYVHYFFVGVGVDQAIHATCLLLTAKYMLNVF